MWYLPLIILGIVLIAILFLKEIFDRKETEEGRVDQKWPYLKKHYLLSAAEKNFYFILKNILKNDYLLFSKVRLEDLFYLPKYQKEKQYYRNKVQSKHVDFLICDPKDIKPLLVIELDDSSHSQDKRIKRDNFVDEIFRDSQLPILHIKNSYNYNVSDLQSEIASMLTK